MEISIPLFIPLLNKWDAIATPVTHFRSCIDSALFNLCRFYCGHCLTLCRRLSKSNPFIVILLHFRALNNLGQKNNHPQDLGLRRLYLWRYFPQIFFSQPDFVLSPPKIPTSPKPSHSSEWTKFIVRGKLNQYASQIRKGLSLAHHQQNSASHRRPVL